MKIDTALNHRNRATQRVIANYRCAELAHYTFSQMLDDHSHVLKSISHCPYWVKAYVEGYRDALTKDHNRNKLEFCSVLKEGDIVSHDRNSPRYYGKLGFSAFDISQGGIVDLWGTFWKDTDKLFHRSAAKC